MTISYEMTISYDPEMIAMSHHPKPKPTNLVARIGQVTVRHYPCGSPYRVFGPSRQCNFYSLEAALIYATDIAGDNAPAQLYRGDWI